MTVQDFLKTLKTAKRAATASSPASLKLNHETINSSSQTPFNTLINSSPCSSTTQSTNNNNSNSNSKSVQTFLSSLTSHQLHSILSDPSLKTSDCFRIFNLILHSQSYLSFKPGFHAHFTIICRLIKSRKFTDAEFLLKKLAIEPIHRYPFADFVLHIEKYCNESNIITKLLNMLLKTYSDHGMFDMASTTFDYMVHKEVERDERTCSVHLYAMFKADKIDLAYEFFCRMLGSSMDVSIYSITIVVSGLCKVGKLKMARELVEEMAEKGVKPNIITCNTLVDACTRRCNNEDLELVLRLMKQQGIQFDNDTYQRLIESYASSGKIEEAEKMLLEMQVKEIEVGRYLYLTVIRGHCRLGTISKSLSLLRNMKERKLRPCVDIYWNLISSLCRVGEMGLVKELVIEMQTSGILLDDDMLSSIIDGYEKAGKIDELAELQGVLDTCSSVHQNSTDDHFQLDLITDDMAKCLKVDSMNDVMEGAVEEMDVDDVLKAYLSSEKD